MDIRKNESPNDPEGRFASSFFADSKDEFAPALEDISAPGRTEKHLRSGLKKFFLFFSSSLLILIIAWGGYFGYKFYSVGKRITIRNESASPASEVGSVISSLVNPAHKPLRGEDSGRINILLLGAAGKGKPGQNLTDTVMVMSIDAKNNRLALLSLPRDLYVRIPGTKSAAKINSLYQYGLNSDSGAEPVKNAVQEVTGLEMNYYAIVDFSGFTRIVDDLDGINVMVERDIYDPRYPGPNYSYETFKLAKGFQHLDGATALKYVRERHDDPEGDFGRAKRQQQVIQAVKNKVFSVGTLFNVFELNSLLSTLGDSVQSDIPLDELESFIALSRRIDTQNINNKVVDAWEKDSLLKVSHIFFGSVRAFVLVPRAGSYGEIHELAANLFDLEALQRRASEIAKEDVSIALLNQSGDPALLTKTRKLLKENLGLDVISAENGPKGKLAEKTEVFDQNDKVKFFTLDELIKKLPASLANPGRAKLAASKGAIMTKADVSVILGKDLIETYSFEEDSAEDFKKAEDNNQEYLIN